MTGIPRVDQLTKVMPNFEWWCNLCYHVVLSPWVFSVSGHALAHMASCDKKLCIRACLGTSGIMRYRIMYQGMPWHIWHHAIYNCVSGYALAHLASCAIESGHALAHLASCDIELCIRACLGTSGIMRYRIIYQGMPWHIWHHVIYNYVSGHALAHLASCAIELYCIYTSFLQFPLILFLWVKRVSS